MASSLWRGPRSAWARWNAVCAVSCNRLIVGRGATLFDARSGAMPASSRPSLTSPLRHDFRDPDVVAPILDRFQEQRLSDVRRIDEGIAAEAVEKRLRLLALDYLREPSAGSMAAHQPVRSMGTPDSVMVGMFGFACSRVAVLTSRMRSRPSRC